MSEAAFVVSGDCDPWHMLKAAVALVTHADDELCIIASILGVPTYLVDPETNQVLEGGISEQDVVERVAGQHAFSNPFNNQAMSCAEAIELCGFWRRLIDNNRGLKDGLGFAPWKQAQVKPLLWDGSDGFRFLRDASAVHHGSNVAIWRGKTSPRQLAALEDLQAQLVEVEDGFIRSQGLGADCVPPLSITVDRKGAHFDPSRPSELELMLQEADFCQHVILRARRLRALIVDAGLSKYDHGAPRRAERLSADARCILVPGQVEDDRAVISGGCGLVRNIDLLKRVRAQAPNAYVVYKPHPDILAGHRLGEIPDAVARQYANEITTDIPIASLIDMVDEVHVNTSLAGFEALLREKIVTTYGVPFYAGWGLTRDLGPVPARRTRMRSLDEIVAATLLLYPRYLDPLSGLPCPAEVLVERLTEDRTNHLGALVTVRRLQGRLRKGIRGFFQ